MMELQAQKLEKMDRTSSLSRRANTPEKKAQGIIALNEVNAGVQYVRHLSTCTDSKNVEHCNTFQ